jgi:NADPH:quinone reductase-like Zn-dependent oxidoreductase
MRAAYIENHGGPEVLKVGPVPDPSFSDNEVLVRVRYSALNHLDVWVRKGMPSLKLQYPHILCGDGAGVVEATGSQVTNVKKGDEVIIHPSVTCLRCEACLSRRESLCREMRILGEHINGTSAEFVKVPSANVFLKPQNMSFSDAASIGLVFTTAWQMVVHKAQIFPGQTVLIHSAGSGVSSAAIQIAKVFGAEVIATAGSEEKRKFAKELGADHVLPYEFADEVRKMTQKKGVDAILDHTGTDLWEKNILAVRAGGRIVICGATSGYAAQTDLRHIFYRQIEILGSTMGSKADFPILLGLFKSGKLRAVVDTIFPLDKVQAAHRQLEDRRVKGKILLALES